MPCPNCGYGRCPCCGAVRCHYWAPWYLRRPLVQPCGQTIVCNNTTVGAALDQARAAIRS